MYQPYAMGLALPPHYQPHSQSNSSSASHRSATHTPRIHPPPLDPTSTSSHHYHHHPDHPYQPYVYTRTHPASLNANADIYTSNGVTYQHHLPSEHNTWSGEEQAPDNHTDHSEHQVNYPSAYHPGYRYFDPADVTEPQPHPHSQAGEGMTINTFLTPSQPEPAPDWEEGEDEISPFQPAGTLGELDPNVALENHDHQELEEGGDEPYFPTAKAKKEARKGKGKAAAPVKVKVKKGRVKGRAKSKAVPTSNARLATPTPKARASALPRTSIRGESKPAISSNAAPSDPHVALTPGHLPHLFLEPREDDSHINTSYFPGLKNVIWPLMPAPIGTHLDVNNLLILHPPALSQSDDTHVPVNQYNRHVADRGQSKFEMYTCRACRKTYDGKNARSVARRHLQDKHGIPLSQQARRTRWDVDGNRPTDAAEAQERSRKCKRDWAKISRQQRSLERLHGDFLSQFGPAGLQTSWKHPLIAPAFRDANALDLGLNDVAWKTADQVFIPASIVQSVLLLAEMEIQIERGEHAPSLDFEALLELDRPSEANALGLKLSITSNGSLISQATSPLRPHFHPYTSTPDSLGLPLDLNPEYHNQLELDHKNSQHGPTTYNQSYPDVYPARTHGNGDVSPVPTHTSLPSLEYQHHLLPGPAGQATDEDDQDIDMRGPLWTQPAWQEWNEFPSTSSSDLRAIGCALAAVDRDAAAEQPIGPAEQEPEVKDEGHEAGLAAESLLDLHSTPLRGNDAESDRSVTPEPLDGALLAQARLAVDAEAEGRGKSARNKRASPATQAPWIDRMSTMVGHYASSSQASRPSVKHHERSSSSSKQPFLQRPAHLQRSLSTTILLDDPFVLDAVRGDGSPVRPRALSSARFLVPKSPTAHRSKDGKRKAPAGSPLAPPLTRAPLDGIHPNQSGSSRLNAQTLVEDQSQGPTLAHSPKKASFQTPLRPHRAGTSDNNPPASAEWMHFSSPADPAASLGLVPMHAVPTTPGISMIIGQDSPVGPVMGGGKRRRGMGMTPRIR